MSDQRHEAAGGNIQRDILENQTVPPVSKGEMVNFHPTAAQRRVIRTPRLARAIHQLENALAGDHRLLQHRLLGGQLDKRLVKASKIADKRVQDPNLDRAHRAKAEQHQQPAQHQRGKKAQQRAQQKTVQAQRLHPRQIVGIAGLAHPFAKARLLAELLDDPHAVDHFVKTIVDVGKPGAHPAHDRRAIALIDDHHDQHRRENRDRHQRHPPVEAKHRHQHRADQRGAAQYRSHHRHVQIANDFRIVGYP